MKQDAILVELRISMHCNACERMVAKAISKIKGVEKFMTDMKNHKVAVMGEIDPQQLMKKLKKKTGKRVEMISSRDNSSSKAEEKDGNSETQRNPNQVMDSLLFGRWIDCSLCTMFNDENANACLIM